MKQVTVTLAVAMTFAGCAYLTPPSEMPSAPPPTQAGMAGSDAQQMSEAKALEQAEAKCASEGKHAVAHRLDNVTVYDCIAPGDGTANPQNPPVP